jgi:geranylgeranyl pyrophosphate synthase
MVRCPALAVRRCFRELLRCVHQRTADVIRGQCAELAGRDRPVTSLAEYEQIVAGKSSALLSLSLELAFIAAGEAAWSNM